MRRCRSSAPGRPQFRPRPTASSRGSRGALRDLPPALLLLLVGLSCADGPAPLPAVHPDVERLEGVRFGLYAADLLEAREEVELAPEAFYQEYLEAHVVVGYGFLPRVEGEPPRPRSRLEGVEIRREVADSAALSEIWTEVFQRAAAIATRPAECTEASNPRFWTRRAVFPDTVRITLVAEVHGEGDGQAYEAFFSTRLETPAMVRSLTGRGDGPAGADLTVDPRIVPCP